MGEGGCRALSGTTGPTETFSVGRASNNWNWNRRPRQLILGGWPIPPMGGHLMSRIDSHVSAVQLRLTLSILVEWLALAAFALATATLAVVIVERLFHFGIPPVTFYVGLGLVALIAIVMTFLRTPSRE